MGVATDKTNEGLAAARKARADEFYTDYADVDAELRLHAFELRGKSVLLPCDGRKSAFWRWLSERFADLELERLTAVRRVPDGRGVLAEMDSSGVRERLLDGDGDFRSEETARFLEKSDAVTTNPPFSLLREFLPWTICSGKKYLVLGNVNAVTYSGVFPEVVARRLRFGSSVRSGDRKFYVPDGYPLEGAACGTDERGRRYIRVKGVRWFTNMDVGPAPSAGKPLSERFSPDMYPKFDFYQAAVDVDSCREIPTDYFGEIGVPITVLDKVGGDGLAEFRDASGRRLLFEVVGQLNGGRRTENFDFAKPVVNGKCKFKRVLIRRVLAAGK